MEFPKRNLDNPMNPWAHDSRVSIHPESQNPYFQGTPSLFT